MKSYKHLAMIGAVLYVLFVAFDSFRAYNGQTNGGKTSKWNVLGRVVNWRVESAATPTIGEVTGAGNNWSFAKDVIKGGAV